MREMFQNLREHWDARGDVADRVREDLADAPARFAQLDRGGVITLVAVVIVIAGIVTMQFLR